MTAVFACCTEYGDAKYPNIPLRHNQSMVTYLYKKVVEIRPFRHSSRFPATTLTTSLTRKTFSSFHAQSSFCILILSTSRCTCNIMSLRGTEIVVIHSCLTSAHTQGMDSYLFFTVAAGCAHMQVWLNRRLKHLKKEKERTRKDV